MKEHTFTGQTSEKNYTAKGKASFPDGFDYKRIDVKGKLDFLGTGKAGSLTVSGKTKGANLSGGKMVFKGSVDIDKIEAEEVTIKGACKIASIKSKTVEIVFSNASAVDHLQAENISLKPLPDEEKERNLNFVKEILPDSWLKEINRFVKIDKIQESLMHIGENCYIHLESIRGENIYLENVKAELVEGKNIVLGPNCAIEKTINL